jgi:serine/threonine protein kinase
VGASGRVVCGYRVLERLGKGGQGKVFLGRHEATGLEVRRQERGCGGGGRRGEGAMMHFPTLALTPALQVALKFVPRAAVDASRVPRMQRELEALQRLSDHPYVCRLHEVAMDAFLPHKRKHGGTL